MVIAATALASPWRSCSGRAPLRVATFNIENYPKSPRQARGAFETIRALDATAVAVQEITDPADFTRAAQRHLGASWRFVFPDGGPPQRVGVLFDGDALVLRGTRVHRECATTPGARPAFEARFTDREGAPLTLLVLHLRAGSTGFETRRAQLRALRPIVAEGMRGPGRYVVLGDFNATGPSDREEIATLARETGARWTSERLGCTSYWARPDGCVGSALDHVVSNTAARSIAALGPCAEFGCNPGGRCPTFHAEVSDHCPVLTVFAPPR